MKKRVGIARATVADAEIVIYDEPTAGLDPVTTQKIYDLLAADQARTGATVLAVSSDVVALAQLRRRDRVPLSRPHPLSRPGGDDRRRARSDRPPVRARRARGPARRDEARRSRPDDRLEALSSIGAGAIRVAQEVGGIVVLDRRRSCARWSRRASTGASSSRTSTRWATARCRSSCSPRSSPAA